MARRLLLKVALSVALAGVVVIGSRAQQAPPATPPSPQQTPAATPTPRPAAPDLAAMNAAMALKDPQEKIAALEKVKVDFPTSSFASTADSQILMALAAMPGKTTETSAQLDKVLARITPATAAEVRLNSVIAAVTPLVTNKILLDRSETLLSEAMGALNFDDFATRQREAAKTRNAAEPATDQLRTTFDTSYRGRGLDLQARVFLAKGDTTKAEAAFCDALIAMPNSAPVALGLAKLEVARGDEKAGLDHYLIAAINAPGLRTTADQDALRALFAKVRGSADGLDAALDTLYTKTFPNPVTPESYKTSAKRSNRVVLLEMFTGSGCPPCVSADLAFDAVMERYPEDAIVSIAYHQNIPQPDPMVVAGGINRNKYYSVQGVPTFNIDGAMGKLGGGARAATGGTYAGYIKSIDAALERPADAELAVQATASGNTIKVTADVSKLPADAKDLHLHLLLVERELRFMGENGIRFHPMVVRAIAGDAGAGLPITGNGKTDYTFDISAMQKDLVDTLAAEMIKRHATEPAGSTPRDYNAEGHAMTTINAGDLMVVAFVQSGAYKAPANNSAAWNPELTNVLQAAAVRVK